MKILAIDTSTAVMGVSLLDDQKVYAETVTNLKKNHSVRLMPIVDQLFTEVNWSPKEIDLIAVAKGPGSYTGVRIGVTTAKTLAWSLNIPIIGVSTLEAMAYNHSNFLGLISPIIDARRGQVYTGLYDSGSNNLLEDRIILLSEWLKIIYKYDKTVLFVGDDLALHRKEIEDFKDLHAPFSSPIFNIPKPSVIGFIAKKKYDSGKYDNTFDFAPAYLQLAEAEVKWLEKQ